MKEKKLTDEVVVKALECCAVEPFEDCGSCPRFTKEKLCHKANARQSLGIIIKSRAENARLEKRNSALLIEKDAMEANCIALQKQVDELTAKNKQLDRDNKHICKELKEVYKELEDSVEDEMKAVKDTAKEILDDFDKHGVYSKDYTDFMRKEYGVEVE